jgi:hypothetical protein
VGAHLGRGEHPHEAGAIGQAPALGAPYGCDSRDYGKPGAQGYRPDSGAQVGAHGAEAVEEVGGLGAGVG